MNNADVPKEGEIYKTLTVSDKTFVLRYGYYSDIDREGEPVPILPDFESKPLYDENGQPFVTRIQDACDRYLPRNGPPGDGWCSDCEHYPDEKEDIGICQCEQKKTDQV